MAPPEAKAPLDRRRRKVAGSLPGTSLPGTGAMEPDAVPPVTAVPVVREEREVKIPVERAVNELVGKRLERRLGEKGELGQPAMPVERLKDVHPPAGMTEIPSHAGRHLAREFTAGIAAPCDPPETGIEQEPLGRLAIEVPEAGWG